MDIEEKKTGIEGTIQAIAVNLTLRLRATRCTIRVPRGNSLWLMASHGAEVESRPKHVKIDMNSIAGQAFITGQIVHSNDINNDPRYDPRYIVSGGPREVIAIPIIFEGICYGVIQIYREKSFSKSHIVFADILAQSAGPALYHIEATKISRRAILELFEGIFKCRSSDEIINFTVETLPTRLGVERCLFYRSSVPWCEITAGVPKREHKIGLRESLHEHPDIEFAVTERKIYVIDQPLTDQRTAHFRRIIEDKNIKAILYIPLVLKNQVIGVIALDATGDKENFSAEERSFCFDAAWIIARVLDRDNETIMEFEDKVFNPVTSFGGYAKKLVDPVTTMCEISNEICRSQHDCPGAEKMCTIASNILPRVTRIMAEAERAEKAKQKIKQIHA